MKNRIVIMVLVTVSFLIGYTAYYGFQLFSHSQQYIRIVSKLERLNFSGAEIDKDGIAKPVKASVIVEKIFGAENSYNCLSKTAFMTDVVPLLGLNKGDRVLDACFNSGVYEESLHNCLMVTVQKYSSSQKTFGLYEITFSLAASYYPSESVLNGPQRFALTSDGIVGTFDEAELINIYDMSQSQYLSWDRYGNINFENRSISSDAMQAISIGEVLRRVLDNNEHNATNDNFLKYQNEAVSTYNSFRKMDKELGILRYYF